MLCLILILVIACSTSNNISQHENKKWKPKYRVVAGINHGGIVENTNMNDIEDVVVDAISGATKIGVNSGIHSLLPLRRNYIEAGVDYIFNNQTFTFNDVSNDYFGQRKIASSQFMLPITYNIGLFRKKYSDGLFQIKPGYVFQYNLYNVKDESPGLPEYTTNNFSKGITLGIASTPFKLKNDSYLGLYFDFYRGSQMYNDLYNRSTFEMPGSSYFKAGIIYQFKH